MMKIKRLGRTGLKVTEVCLGTMTFGHQCDEAASFAIMDEAAARSVNFIDQPRFQNFLAQRRGDAEPIG